jgi:hypothetical protein
VAKLKRNVIAEQMGVQARQIRPRIHRCGEQQLYPHNDVRTEGLANNSRLRFIEFIIDASQSSPHSAKNFDQILIGRFRKHSMEINLGQHLVLRISSKRTQFVLLLVQAQENFAVLHSLHISLTHREGGSG